MPGRCSFNNIWLHVEKNKSWLEKVEDPGRVEYVLCSKTFDVANMGEAALTSHAKRQAAVAAREANSITSFLGFFFTPRITNVTPTTASSSITATCF